MTWRRAAPWVILVLSVFALFVDLPRKTLHLDCARINLPGCDLHSTLGLDLQGGVRVTLQITPQSGAKITDQQVEVARNILEKRVAGIGVSEPQVRTEVAGDGTQRIVVEVPGVSNPQQVRDLVGSTGQLQFIDPQGQTLTEGQDVKQLRSEERRVGKECS